MAHNKKCVLNNVGDVRAVGLEVGKHAREGDAEGGENLNQQAQVRRLVLEAVHAGEREDADRKSTRLNSSH